MMGGSVSHEYMASAEAGEDEIVFCRECGYAANVEMALAGADREPPHSEVQAAAKSGGSAAAVGQSHSTRTAVSLTAASASAAAARTAASAWSLPITPKTRSSASFGSP